MRVIERESEGEFEKEGERKWPDESKMGSGTQGTQ